MELVMKTNKMKMAIEGLERMNKFFLPYIDQLEIETQQAIDGDYFDNMMLKCRAIKQHAYIQDLINMKDQIENPESHLEHKEFGMFSPEYCKESLAFWKEQLDMVQKGIENKQVKLKKLEARVLEKTK
jgi:hypothetical protein